MATPTQTRRVLRSPVNRIPRHKMGVRFCAIYGFVGACCLICFSMAIFALLPNNDLAIIETETSRQLLDDDALAVQWDRSTVDAACPPSNRSLRPNDGDVPGKRGRISTFTNDAAFGDNGYIGPYPSSFTPRELLTIAGAIDSHQKSVFTARKKSSKDRETIYGRRDVLMDRCYAFDPLCEKLARDPMILDKVRQIIGDDIIVWSMEKFAKKDGKIHPWHTDIEPYDRCYGKNVQIWLAVDQVTPESTLQLMTTSHRMPSITWLYPEHISFAKTIPELESFERETLLPCAHSLDPNARIVSPVVQDGDFMLFHSNMWHAARVNGSSLRQAIRINYSTPDCQIGAVDNYSRPDIPPLRPIAALPPVLLVSGSARSLPEVRRVTNNFLHFRNISACPHKNKDERRRRSLADANTTIIARHWSQEKIKAGEVSRTVPGNLKKIKSKLLSGNTPLLETLEIHKTLVKPFEAAHNCHDYHDEDAEIFVVTEGRLGFHSMHTTGLLPMNKELLGPIPDITVLTVGGIFSLDRGVPHNLIGGAEGGSIVFLKFSVRNEFKVDDVRATAPSLGFHSFRSPPMDNKNVNPQIFFEKNFSYLSKLVGFTCRCEHKLEANDDHETIMFVEHVPENVALYLLPTNEIVEEGAVLYFPLNADHGIEARQNVSERVVSFRKNRSYSDVPRCLVFELWAK